MPSSPSHHISSLKSDPRNARRHNPRNVGMVEHSLQRDGFGRSILVANDGTIIAGNATVEAAAAAGIENVIVVESDGKSIIAVKRTDVAPGSPEFTKLALSDNRAAELAEWDAGVLASLADDGVDLSQFWFEDELADVMAGDDEPAEGLTDPDDVPESPAEPVTKRGDMWLLGRHRLLCGDSTVITDVDRLMDGVKAELCFTSPPYSDQREYTGDGDLSPSHLSTFLSAAADHVELFAVNLGLARKGGEVVTYWDEYISTAKSAGMKLLSWNVWNRQGYGGFTFGQISAMFAIEHEFIFVFGAKESALHRTVPNKHAGTLNSGTTNRQRDGSLADADDVVIGEYRQLGTVFSCGTDKSKSPHPAAFPVEMPLAYIEAASNPGKVVYDPFLGSGTTMIAAEQAARTCYGLELSPAYCDVIVRRWENFTGQTATLATELSGVNT